MINCWICGADATTREHKQKRSDLRSVFGAATQAKPLYYHDNKSKNRFIKSLDADRLKFPKGLCDYCNNTRTQPHDRAWECLSQRLLNRKSPAQSGNRIRGNRIFCYNTSQEMLNVHLYFVKQFGCHIIEGHIPIDVAEFSNAIMNGKPILICIYNLDMIALNDGKSTAGTTNIEALQRNSDGVCEVATYIYVLNNITVQVMFSNSTEKPRGLAKAWHPRYTNNFVMIDSTPL